MKTSQIFKSLIILAAGIITAGCTEKETPQIDFTLEKDKIEATAAGGQFIIEYYLENATAHENTPHATTEDDWVNNFEYSDKTISFSIDPNPDKEIRQTVVTVTYEGFEGERKITITQDADSDFILSTKNIDIPAEGGEFTVTYTLSGNVENSSVTASCPDSWITSIDCSSKGEIKFTASANKSAEKRIASINAKCGGNELTASFTVTQEGQDKPETSEFHIEIVDKTPIEVTYSVTPQDKEITYMSMTISKESFDKYGNEEEFFASEIKFHEMMAEVSGMTLEEYLNIKLRKGDCDNIKEEYLEPSTEYYAYAYGLDQNGNILSSLSKQIFKTTDLEHKDMTFDFEYTVTDMRADITVYPNLAEDWYFFSAMRTEGLDGNQDMTDVIEDYINYVIEYYMISQGGTIQEAIEKIAYRGIGMNSFELMSEKEYVIFAAAIDLSTGKVISEVSKEYFTSPKAESDNKIMLETTYLGFTNSSIFITTTTQDPYVFCIDKAENWEGMTNEEMLEKLTKNDMSYFIRNGNFLAQIQNRTPGTEYRAFAFGYMSGIATTPLTTTTFKTHDFAESDIEITIKFDKYYDIDELKKLYPDEFAGISDMYKITMPVWTSLKGNDTTGVSYYYSVYPGDWTESSDIYSMAETILNEGCPLPETNFYFLRDSYLQTHTFIGIAADKNGNFGQLFRKAFNMTDDGISPAEDYPLDKFEQQAPAGKSFAYETADTAFDINVASSAETSKEEGPRSIGQYVLSPDAARKIK